MAGVRVTTNIDAPREVCFDLARDIDFHVRSLQHTGERAVAGVTSGLIGLGESVTWKGRHLGVRQRLTAEVTAFNRPHYFQDRMTHGAFARFEHDHYFDETSDGRTVMRDVVRFASPRWVLGRVIDRLILRHYLSRLLAERGQAIKAEAERRAGNGEGRD